MPERYPEAELVLDDELLYDEAPRRSMLRRTEERAEDIVREGEVLAGKYRVERIPGRNGLGVLVQVRHMELGQEVTLKFLVPEACAYPEFVQRFVREARAAVRIQGEHVARVTDVGRLESGAPYMVREYLRGPDLAEVLKVRGPLPVSEAVDYIIQACEGVAEGHALGVVHRNLRPTSLIVARRSDGTPLVKVFDFAASESLHVNPFTERAVSLVGTSAIMASLPYLAPEQIRDPHDVDYRADVYSLGAVLFELLTGTPVYSADAAPALLAQVAADPAPSVRSLRSDIPGELDHIVLRCLAKNRAIRYSGIAELVLALGQFASADGAACIDHIVRLAKRTSKLPQLSAETRSAPSSLPPAPASSPNVTAPLPPVAPISASTPAPARGRHGTVMLHTAEPVQATSLRPSVHEDVTTINPYASYGAPVVITPSIEPPRSEAPRTEPLRNTEPLRTSDTVRSESRSESPRTEPLRSPRAESIKPEPLRTSGRHTPQPPPLRSSVPPPLREPSQHALPPLPTPPPPAPVANERASERVHARTAAPAVRREASEMPQSPRSSMSGLSRSWAVPEEPAAAPIFTQRRLIAMAAVAACATLGAVVAMRGQHGGAAVAAAAPLAVPAKAPPAAPVVAPAPVEPVPVVAASASVAAAPAPAPVAAAPAPVPVAAVPAAPVAAAVVAPAPVAAAPRPVVAAAPRPVAYAAPRRPAPREEAPVEAAARKPAAPEKLASSKPAGTGDLFDDPR